MASARPRNDREPVERLFDRVLCVFSVDRLLGNVHLRTHTADPASVGIDYTATDLDARHQTELLGRLRAEIADDFACGGPEAVLHIPTSQL
jgi:hypothetical protein